MHTKLLSGVKTYRPFADLFLVTSHITTSLLWKRPRGNYKVENRISLLYSVIVYLFYIGRAVKAFVVLQLFTPFILAVASG